MPFQTIEEHIRKIVPTFWRLGYDIEPAYQWRDFAGNTASAVMTNAAVRAIRCLNRRYFATGGKSKKHEESYKVHGRDDW